jgi:glutamate---cysteine ligase / carboxylate-amine ligase
LGANAELAPDHDDVLGAVIVEETLSDEPLGAGSEQRTEGPALGGHNAHLESVTLEPLHGLGHRAHRGLDQQQHSARQQVAGGASADQVEECPPARPALPRSGATTDRPVGPRKVWRVRDDEVEASSLDRLEQIAALRFDAHAVEQRVRLDCQCREPGDVQRHRSRSAFCRRQREEAAPRAEVEDARVRPQSLAAEASREQPGVAGRLEDSRYGQKPHAVNGSRERTDETQATAADALRAAFDGVSAYTVGVEEEVMLLSPRDLQLAPRAQEVLGLVDGDPRFKLEMPASQLEILTSPVSDIRTVEAELRAARGELAGRCERVAVVAAAGTHPCSPGVGEINSTPRYQELIDRYGAIARRQLVCALQAHVAVGNADRALAVYNALRSYLPLLAALAANAPFYEGGDTGFASIRPKIAELLPRQGIPPAFASWESYARTLGCERALPDLRNWWWELRLHAGYGTLELRVPDAQSTAAEAAAIAGVAQCLVAWLGGRHDAGETLAIAPSWRIEGNRWSAAHDGVDGAMVDLETGGRRSTRAWLSELLDQLTPTARRLGAEQAIERARALADANGAILQRRAAGLRGPRAAVSWLVERFLE